MASVTQKFVVALMMISGCAQPDPKSTYEPLRRAEASGAPDGRCVGGGLVYEFPAVLRDENPKLTLRVPVVNDTGKPIVVSSVTASCNCSHASLPKRVLDILETSELEVEVNLAGRSGFQRFVVTLGTERGPWKYFELCLRVIPPWQLSDGQSEVRLPASDPGVEVTHRLVLETFGRTSQGPRAVTGIDVSLEGWRTAFKEVSRELVADGIAKNSYEVMLRGRAPGHARTYSGYLTLALGAEVERIPISGTVKPHLTCSPDSVFFSLQTGPIPSRLITVRRLDGEALTLSSPRLSSPGLAVAVKPTANPAVVQIELRLALESLSGDSLWGEAVFETNHPKQPEVRVTYGAIRRRVQSPQKECPNESFSDPPMHVRRGVAVPSTSI